MLGPALSVTYEADTVSMATNVKPPKADVACHDVQQFVSANNNTFNMNEQFENP